MAIESVARAQVDVLKPVPSDKGESAGDRSISSEELKPNELAPKEAVAVEWCGSWQLNEMNGKPVETSDLLPAITLIVTPDGQAIRNDSKGWPA